MRTRVTAAAAVLAAALLVTGCATPSSDPGQSTPDPTTGAETSAAAESSPPDDGASAAPSTTDAASAAPSTGGGVDELRDGVWQVGDAGEVEFALDGDALSLVEVRPADGWAQRVADEQADEIEVHFTRGGSNWKFEVELGATGMEISQELQIAPAESGTYQVGSAAEVTFDSDATTVTLGDVSPSEGWTITKQDESTDGFEIDFSNEGGGTAEFEVELGDNGLEMEISQKLNGPTPS